jgi:uncharacterized membrane protein YagU involved in acid resistance
MSNTRTTPLDVGALAVKGAIGGLISGIVFAMAEMFLNLFMGKPFLGPLRLISTIVLGKQAAGPDFPLATSLGVGLITHMMMSIIFGLVFVLLLAVFRQLSSSTGRLLALGSIYGLGLWVVNFIILAPIFFPQFGNVNPFWNGFFAHTVFFGTAIGLYFSIAKPSEESAKVVTGKETSSEHSLG